MITALGIMWFALWAKVTLQPIYSDARFTPADKLAAWCTNSADILFTPQGQDIKKFTLVLYYNPDTMEILRILPTSKNGEVTSKIEYNKIIFEVNTPIFDKNKDATTFFQLSFKSDTIGKETLVLGTGSEAITASKSYPLNQTFTLDFDKVPECEPDIVPPNINLIFPKDTEQNINLDQYFIFDIKDIGKWVDKNSVTISFDGEQYFYGSDNLKRNGNYLTFYPGKRIPINKNLDMKILVTDKQSYGWSNKAQSTYSFHSATGMALNKDINPMLFRQISQEATKISASPKECAILADWYSTAELPYQKNISSIIQKVWCDLASVDAALLAYENDTPTGMNNQEKQYRNLSVFATLGWILFLLAFTLKMHYLFSCRKHKQTIKTLSKNIHE